MLNYSNLCHVILGANILIWTTNVYKHLVQNGLVDDYDDALARSYIVCTRLQLNLFFFLKRSTTHLLKYITRVQRKENDYKCAPLGRLDCTYFTTVQEPDRIDAYSLMVMFAICKWLLACIWLCCRISILSTGVQVHVTVLKWHALDAYVVAPN